MNGLQEFKQAFPKVKEEIQEILKEFPEWVQKHCFEMIDYNVAGGKNIRAQLIYAPYIELTGSDPASPEVYIAYLLAYALEFVHSAFLIADDFMDHSTTRRGKECWYLKKEIGSTSINDTVIFENIAMLLLSRHRGKELTDESYYTITQLFRDVFMKTAMGQSFDVETSSPLFSHYEQVVNYKTSYYSFYLPFIAGCYLSGKFTIDQLHQDLEPVLLKIGYYFQAQDDYLDVYGDHSQTGKMGSDIQDGKLTWLACKAFELTNSNLEKHNILRTCLGQKDSESVQKVRDLYDELKMKDLFEEFVKKEVSEINDMISHIPSYYPKHLIQHIMGILSHRSS